MVRREASIREYAHADNHTLVFHPGYNGTTNKIMFNGSDGGIFVTNDARAPVSYSSNPITSATPGVRQHGAWRRARGRDSTTATR